MKEPQEFPCPICRHTHTNSPTSPVVVQHAASEEDRAFSIAVEALRALQRSERNAVINFLLRWLDLPSGRRAGLAVAAMPELSPAEVAVLCGKSVRQLDRYEEYRALKPTLEDYLEPKRRRWTMPEEPTD